MSKRTIRSLSVFVCVVAVLGVGGYWLNHLGHLDLPRVFDLPGVLGGSGEQERGREGGGPPAGEFSAGQNAGAADQNVNSGNGTAFGGGRQQGGDHDHQTAAGLTTGTMLDMLSDLWIIAVIIAGVVYGGRLLSAVFAPLRRSRTAPAGA